MNIRPMNVSDYDAVDCLMQKLHKVHVLGRPDLYVDMEHPYSKQEFEALVKDENVISILAEEEQNVLGICVVKMRERSMMVDMSTAYMDDLIVEDSCRRQGIAEELFCYAEKEAKEKGAKRLDLMVWSFNEDAIAFYKKMGMTPQRYIFEKKF